MLPAPPPGTPLRPAAGRRLQQQRRLEEADSYGTKRKTSGDDASSPAVADQLTAGIVEPGQTSAAASRHNHKTSGDARSLLKWLVAPAREPLNQEAERPPAGDKTSGQPPARGGHPPPGTTSAQLGDATSGRAPTAFGHEDATSGRAPTIRLLGSTAARRRQHTRRRTRLHHRGRRAGGPRSRRRRHRKLFRRHRECGAPCPLGALAVMMVAAAASQANVAAVSRWVLHDQWPSPPPAAVREVAPRRSVAPEEEGLHGRRRPHARSFSESYSTLTPPRPSRGTCWLRLLLILLLATFAALMLQPQPYTWGLTHRASAQLVGPP